MLGMNTDWSKPLHPHSAINLPGRQVTRGALLELRELVRLRQQLLQQLGDQLRHLHRAVDLGFPEFTRYVGTLQSELTTTILSHYPTAAGFRRVSVKKFASACTTAAIMSVRSWRER